LDYEKILKQSNVPPGPAAPSFSSYVQNPRAPLLSSKNYLAQGGGGGGSYPPMMQQPMDCAGGFCPPQMMHESAGRPLISSKQASDYLFLKIYVNIETF
jgi:hypothetical protein